MPELPEVEIVKQSLNKSITGKIIKDILIKNRNLRFKIPKNFEKNIVKKKIIKVDRFSKHLILKFEDNSNLMIHLGMSGSLRVVKNNQEHIKHDHVDFIFGSEFILRFHDPRKFGSILWTDKDPTSHKLIAHLGPEPLS